MVDDEARLVALARSGHAEAFAHLVLRHQVRVYRIALRMLGNPADAEDAAQEAFLAAWRGLDRFRFDSSFSTWLQRIVVNRCLNVLRARRSTPEQPADHEPVAIGGPQEAVEVYEQMAALRRALQRLTPEQRAAFVLRYLEGCTLEEIARVLGISLSAVKSRLHRARAELIAAMEAQA
jgi:RNA polymerase sigma-70 factor (ECF subfamily)